MPYESKVLKMKPDNEIVLIMSQKLRYRKPVYIISSNWHEMIDKIDLTNGKPFLIEKLLNLKAYKINVS
jgi:hypothetical protein